MDKIRSNRTKISENQFTEIPKDMYHMFDLGTLGANYYKVHDDL